MVHSMHLHHQPFTLIKNGTKTIEMRLNDEKRKIIKVGDRIQFDDRLSHDICMTEVIGLHYFSSFQKLYQAFDKEKLGYLKEEDANPEDMEQYYSKEEEEQYGVVGIEIKLLERKDLNGN